MELGRAYSRTVLLTMMMFKLGIFCTVTAEKCLSSPCQNGGTCMDTMDDYVCICPKDPVWYTGKNCDVLYDACTFVNCPNCISTPGTNAHICPCVEGFGGPNCTENINECESNPCRGVRTHCVDEINGYSCYCPSGYGGENCQTKVRDCSDEPCFNNATCVWAPDGYECRCAAGFRGTNCEEDIDECLSQPCKNGAICQDGADRYQCFCVPGFQGYNCEIDINECASRPCENNGTCINGKDRYTCDCLPGFTGVNCETEIDECEAAPCQNGATCLDHIGLYICQCVPGYEGINCELDIDECVSGPCFNDGVCVDMVNGYECDCSGTGFVGDTCEEDIPECSSDPCHHAATCQEGVNQYTCLCWPGYTGENCQVDIDECEAGPCENGGECFQRSDRSHYRVLPELDREFTYERAAGFLCQCQPGFTGENCSVNIDECESMPCENGGECVDLINAYRCVCSPGFTGVLCEVNIDECESNPCQNGAACEDGVDDYLCHCPAAEEADQLPWGGHDCDTPLTGCVDNPCQNGGTCTPTLQGDEHGHVCQCPPGFYDNDCSTPTAFSFSAGGFVAIKVPHSNRTRRETDPQGVSVQLRFRTTLPDLILFYRGNAEHFCSLEIMDGELHARAVTEGVELKVHIPGALNNGRWHDALVVLDEKLILSLVKENITADDGDHNRLLLFQPQALETLYVGGVPREYLNNTVTRKGYIGCLEDLLVDSLPILPQNISSENAVDMQLGCDKTEWCHPDPCSQNGQCVDLWTEYRCDCYRPFYGNSCAEEYTSWTFSHERNNSYVEFRITQNHGENFSISFFLRSLKKDGLILQLKRVGHAYLTVFLRVGRIHVSIHSSTRDTLAYVSDGVKHMVTMEMNQRIMYFNNGSVLFRLVDFTDISVEEGDVVYVGGLPAREDISRWGGFFKGCLQDIRLDNTQLYVYQNNVALKPQYSRYLPRAVSHVHENCISDNVCRAKPCLHGGECQVTWNDFVCLCPPGFTGKTCETRVWCVSDPCVMGSVCVDLWDGYECLANATFQNNALRYTGGGSLSETVDSVSVELRTREENGVLLRASNGLDLFCMGLFNSSLLVKLRSGNSLETLALTSNLPLSDGTWHRVEFRMADPSLPASRWHLAVDGQTVETSLVTMGNLDFLSHSTLFLAENYTGCLGDVRVGGVYLPLAGDKEEPQAARFSLLDGIRPHLGCRGAPLCQSQPCQNNGSCQDLFNQYSCNCAPGWEGEFCQNNVDECASGPCAHGVCRDLLADYECECTPGYGGKNCQEDLNECLEHSCENGGSCQDAVGTYTCLCPPGYTGPLCQWPFPPPLCEEDVKCENGGVCTDEIWGPNCTCKPGFSGNRCETDIDECASSPCLNNATCMNRVNHFECICVPGYIGQTCEITRQHQRDHLPWLVLAIPLVCLAAVLAVVGLTCMVLTARKKRQSEGTYSPSQQEVAGARLEMDSVLKVPPEERLI
ncbi:protein crumbs homolog 2b [Chanos chanos]|uniref:Protein crumbs homolog 2b n=1 Tax=Chanos chanos TaxID=29144 RepID=A0A6J2WDH3_CHACN|nr:protein crumbs homolog 2-like [Chanos chanos]